MLINTLNYYSLIIPLFMMMLGLTIIIVRQIVHIPKYLIMYAICSISIGISLFLYSILSPNTLVFASCLTSSLSFISSAFFCSAVHLRLKIKMNWPLVILLIAIAELIILYFSWIDDNYTIRLLTLGIIPILIWSHNLKSIYNLYLHNILDRILRSSLVILILISVLRIGYLLFFWGGTNNNLGNVFLRSSMQFIILYISTALICLLMCCAYQDILKRLRLERNEDPLTGLLNRRALNDQIEYLRKTPVSPNAILICDLDYFKKINDQYGHYVGDIALKHVSQLLKSNMHSRSITYKYDTIYRIGGEEFMIILKDITQNSAITVAEKIRENIECSPLIFEDNTIPLTISIGISFFYFYSEFDDAMRKADKQLYDAKSLGRNCIRYQNN